MAATLARGGLRILIVELEGRPDTARAFGGDGLLSYEPRRLLDHASGGSVDGRCLRPDDALIEYLGDHGLGRISKRLASSGVLDVVAGAIPGIKDVLVLGKVKQIANESEADVILVDAPATGHAVPLLTSAAGLTDIARSGPVNRQAGEVVEMLSDPARCQVMLVTIPEELPVTETIEAAYLVEDRAGVALGPVIANRVDTADRALAVPAETAAAEAGVVLADDVATALDAAAAFQRRRARVADEALERLRRELPLEILELPRLTTASIGPDEIALLADALETAIASLEEQSR